MAEQWPSPAGVVRYVPEVPFPSYRHLPGETPHPHRHPQGHRFRDPFEGAVPENAGWRRDKAYLLGIDLYNHGFWWEAHEQWEPKWQRAGPGTAEGLFLQGLIQLAAAAIKQHQGNERGFRLLSGNGLEKLEEVAGRRGTCFMGLDVEAFAAAWREFLALGVSGGTAVPPIRLGLSAR